MKCFYLWIKILIINQNFYSYISSLTKSNVTAGDGLIQLRELEHVLRACMEENGMRFSDEQIEDLTIALFEDADQGNRGAITFEALKRQLEKHEGLLENLTIR